MSDGINESRIKRTFMADMTDWTEFKIVCIRQNLDMSDVLNCLIKMFLKGEVKFNENK